jgi:hypothetical protein
MAHTYDQARASQAAELICLHYWQEMQWLRQSLQERQP